MASLIASLITDNDLETNGTWVVYTPLTNDDNTHPEFKIKRVSIENVDYQKRVTPILKQIDELQKANNVDVSKLYGLQKEMNGAFIDEMLVDWRGVKYPAERDAKGNVVVDKNGVPVCKDMPFTKENVSKLLRDNKNAQKVIDWLVSQSTDMANYLADKREQDLKL